MGLPHDSRVVWVKVDADMGIAQMVAMLNKIDGVRTHSSCQGTIGEGGPHPYRAYVMCSWTPEALRELQARYIVRPAGNGTWGYVHPQSAAGLPDGAQGDEEKGRVTCRRVQWALLCLGIILGLLIGWMTAIIWVHQ